MAAILEPVKQPPVSAHVAHCRFCGERLEHTFVDLGLSPLCQTHIEPQALHRMEPFYPLHARVCGGCWLVQLEEFVAPDEIFSDYAYFSSYSDSWIEHARRYVDAMTERFGIGQRSLVVEIASNDGYLLQHFVHDGVPVHGIEPAANVARVAVDKRVPTTVAFFGVETARAFARDHGRPQLLLGNNVLAHVPDINDFVAGMRELLAPEGVITMEFPHLLQLMKNNQYDTIYHEHFSYLSLTTVERIFAAHELVLFDVEELPTHGGSLRIYARHREDVGRPVGNRVDALRERERAFGLTDMVTYTGFGEKVHETKRRLLSFLIDAKSNGKRIVGYGAPGKGNTLLNYCGIRTDFLDFTVDRSPHKQGRYTPGTRIPILDPSAIREARPDYVLILPWNLEEEVRRQTAFIREWGGQWVVPIPEPRVIDHIPDH
ncbi:class I SAM-dependent methyltransferase [Halofilum ochraceum]|uniref:class I SAM-dependent methyltransferase n=1 Tax=Halofilum ochraceum TaxID=1611323 RepID=UPI000B0C8CD0|nr:class I SAM-dependent methyltransferase [Halofilum ochraceum]